MDTSVSGDFTEGMVGDVEEPHVLAVDDNLVDRKIVEKLLKNSSCRVTTTENGLKALEYLGLGDNNQSSTVNNDVSKVNLIITDYCMPGMTGYELLNKIKESSVMKDVPVVIMSSENIPTRINKCLEKGYGITFSKASQILRCEEVALPAATILSQNIILILE